MLLKPYCQSLRKLFVFGAMMLRRLYIAQKKLAEPVTRISQFLTFLQSAGQIRDCQPGQIVHKIRKPAPY